MELWGNLLGRDVLVMRRKTVSLHAERALPDLRAHVDLAEGIEDSAARRLTNDGLILE